MTGEDKKAVVLCAKFNHALETRIVFKSKSIPEVVRWIEKNQPELLKADSLRFTVS